MINLRHNSNSLIFGDYFSRSALVMTVDYENKAQVSYSMYGTLGTLFHSFIC